VSEEMMKVRNSIWPKSLLGRWSAGLAIVFILLLVLSGVLTGLGGVGPGPVGPILGVTFGTSGIAALVTGLISIIKGKERSLLVFVAVAVGLFVLIFFLGEFLFPH
jgi:membrane associated rhomboid family serine protease